MWVTGLDGSVRDFNAVAEAVYGSECETDKVMCDSNICDGREKKKPLKVPKIHNAQVFQIFITFSPCNIIRHNIVSDSKFGKDCDFGMM